MANGTGRLLYLAWKFIDRYSLLLLLGASVVTFIIGWFGFELAFARQGKIAQDLDTIYYSLQLFTFKFGPGTGLQVDNLFLQFARFCAPALTFLSLLAVVLAHFFNNYILAIYLRHFVRDHVVICGLGYIGPEIATLLADENRLVVVIEKDPTNPAIHTCRSSGIFVLNADAASSEVLKRAAVDRAGELFVVTGDDARNLGIAYRVQDMRQNERIDLSTLRVHCHIGDAELCSNIRGKTLLTTGDSGVIIEPFNIYQIAGYCLTKADNIFERVVVDTGASPVQKCGAEPSVQATFAAAPASNPDLHILIIGIGRMGEALLVRLIRRWRELNNGSRLKLTVIDEEAPARQKALEAKYPALKNYADVTWLKIKLDHADAVLGDPTLRASLSSVTHTYFCIDNPSLGLATALTLSRKTAPGSITRMRSLRKSEISPLIEQLSMSLAECRQIREFHITSNPCCLSIMRRGMSELMARLNHDAYLKSQWRLHGRDVKKPSVVPWKALTPEKRDSNREQAFDLGNKLRRIQYTVAPLTDWDEPLVDFEKIPFYDTTALEAMSEWEHERWMAEKKRKNWEYADIPEQDEQRKLHPDLKPYKDLDETVKQYDRDYIRSIPKTLCRMDLKLVPADPGCHPSGSGEGRD